MSGAADFLPAYYSLSCVRQDFIIIVAFIPSLVQTTKSPLLHPPLHSSPPLSVSLPGITLPSAEMSTMASGAKLEASHPPKAANAPAPAKKVHYPFWFGGSASCFAAAVTHPLDLGKL